MILLGRRFSLTKLQTLWCGDAPRLKLVNNWGLLRSILPIVNPLDDSEPRLDPLEIERLRHGWSQRLKYSAVELEALESPRRHCDSLVCLDGVRDCVPALVVEVRPSCPHWGAPDTTLFFGEVAWVNPDPL